MKTLSLLLLLSSFLVQDTIARPQVHDLSIRDAYPEAAESMHHLEARQANGEDCDDGAIQARQNRGGRGGQGGGRGRGGQGGNRGASGQGTNNAANAGGNRGGNNGNNAANNGANNGNNAAANNGGNGGNRGGNNNNNAGNANNNAGNNNNNGNNGNNNNGNNGAAATTAAAAAASTPVAANENGKPGPSVPQLNVNGGLTLPQSLIMKVNPGGDASIGEAQSAVSNNNFITFCQGKTLINGQQIQTGSCAVTPLGDIPATTKMVSTFFTSPKNGQTIKAGQTFTIGLQTQGMTLGSFTNAKANYYAGPQQLASDGTIVGHAHITVQQMASAGSTAVLDPTKFSFFKGMDFADVNGLSTIDVQGGLTAGAYRICTIMSNSNHASVVMPVAQRGAENTCSYFNVA